MITLRWRPWPVHFVNTPRNTFPRRKLNRWRTEPKSPVECETPRLTIGRRARRGFRGNPLPAQNDDGMVATFSAQGQPIPRVRLPRSFQHSDFARLLAIQNIDGPVPAVLCSRRLGGADRTGVRGEDAQTILDQFRWKDLYADGYAGQTAGNVTLRRAIAENLNGAAPGEFTSPYDFSGLGTLIIVARRCVCGQWPRDNWRH